MLRRSTICSSLTLLMNSTFLPLWTKDADGILRSGRLDAETWDRLTATFQGASRETALTTDMWGSQPNTAVIRAFEDAGIVFVASQDDEEISLRFKVNRKNEQRNRGRSFLFLSA